MLSLSLSLFSLSPSHSWSKYFIQVCPSPAAHSLLWLLLLYIFFLNYYYLDYYSDVFIPCWAMRSILYPHSFASLCLAGTLLPFPLIYTVIMTKKNTYKYINIYDARHRLPGIRESIWAIPHPGHLGHAYGSAHRLLCVICTSKQGFSSIVSSHPRGHTTTPKDSGKFSALREEAKWRAQKRYKALVTLPPPPPPQLPHPTF